MVFIRELVVELFVLSSFRVRKCSLFVDEELKLSTRPQNFVLWARHILDYLVLAALFEESLTGMTAEVELHFRLLKILVFDERWGFWQEAIMYLIVGSIFAIIMATLILVLFLIIDRTDIAASFLLHLWIGGVIPA